jgi:hypothetical protein
MRRASIAAGLVGASLMMAVPTAPAAPPPDKELCKSQGFKNYLNPSQESRTAFASNAECVAFAKEGGEFIPYLTSDEPDITIIYVKEDTSDNIPIQANTNGYIVFTGFPQIAQWSTRILRNGALAVVALISTSQPTVTGRLCSPITALAQG